MARQKSDELPFAAPEVGAQVVRWLDHLGAERRMSPKTLKPIGATCPVPRLPG